MNVIYALIVALFCCIFYILKFSEDWHEMSWQDFLNARKIAKITLFLLIAIPCLICSEIAKSVFGF